LHGFADGFFTCAIKMFLGFGEVDKAVEILNQAKSLKVGVHVRQYRHILHCMKSGVDSMDRFELQQQLYDEARLVPNNIVTSTAATVVDTELYKDVLEGLSCAVRVAHETQNQALKVKASQKFTQVLADSTEDIHVPSFEFLQVVQQHFCNTTGADLSKHALYSSETHASVAQETSCCSHCDHRLKSLELDDSERKDFIERLRSLMPVSPHVMKAFDRWVEGLKRQKIDCIVDVANVGFFLSPHFDFETANAVIQKLESMGKRPAMVLHTGRVYEARKNRFSNMTINAWQKESRLFEAPKGSNDDWFWLLATASLPGRALVITNDQMRDHHFNMLHMRGFNNWKERHVVNFDLNVRDPPPLQGIRFFQPPPYSMRSQVELNGDQLVAYHAPYLPDDETLRGTKHRTDAEILRERREKMKWFCLSALPPKSSEAFRSKTVE